MRIFLCTLLALFLGSATLLAQAPVIEKSDAFDEPGIGWNKVLMVKNGNTMYFHFTKKDGIEVVVYDKSRKASATKTITSELWEAKKMRGTAILGLYEINNEAVLFMCQAEGRTPTLYRLRFSTTTGDMVKEDELGSLPRVKLVSFNPEGNNIFVEKDPVTDCYAIIYFNGFAKDKDERIKVEHYDGSHKMINIAYYESPDENFKYLRFIGAVCDGNKRVFISTYGAASIKGKDAHVYISCLKSGDSIFANKVLDFTEDFKETKSVMAYNHNNNIIQLLTLSFARGRVSFFGNGATTAYLSFLSYIDPETMNIKAVKPLAGAKINEYAHNTLGLDINYRGLPQQMVINADNSTTILSEEQTQEITVDQHGNVVAAVTYLGAIGVNEITPDGTEKSGQVAIKLQAAGGLFDPLYISARSKGRWGYLAGAADYNSYMSYDYIYTDKNRYVLFNDNAKNFDKDEDQRRRKIVVNINKINTVCYSLNGTEVNKFYLFGNPEDKDQSFSCHIEASDYDKSSNTYATIMVERNGRDRVAKMVWVKFN